MSQNEDIEVGASMSGLIVITICQGQGRVTVRLSKQEADCFFENFALAHNAIRNQEKELAKQIKP